MREEHFSSKLQWNFNMKYFLILISFANILFSFSIDESLLKIHATLVPKISLMDYNLQERSIDNSLVIAIFYESVDYRDALFLKKLIDTKYNQSIGSYKIKTKLVTYSENIDTKANVYYFFPTDALNIKRAVKSANLNQALTFSYSKKDLQEGVMLSVLVGIKVKPILNLKAVKSSSITFRPVLLDISEIYKDEDSK